MTWGASWSYERRFATRYGYGSIPINTIFRGMNIHKSQLFWCELQGYKVLTHCHISKIHFSERNLRAIATNLKPGLMSLMFFFELKSCRLPLIWGQPHLQPFNLIVPKFGLFPFRWPWLHWGYLPQFDVENPFNVDQFNQINHGFRMGKHLENQVWSWKKTRLFRIYLNLTGKIHG